MNLKQYPHKDNFDKYTEKFKNYITELEKAKFSTKEILKPGVGEVTFKKNKGLKNDFKGLYAFWENSEVVYVGISGKVIGRLYDHIKSSTHFTATFAVKIMQTDDGFKKSRSEVTKEQIKNVIENRISNMEVSYVKIEPEKGNNRDTELYLFEVYAAIYFQAKYNTFETH